MEFTKDSIVTSICGIDSNITIEKLYNSMPKDGIAFDEDLETTLEELNEGYDEFGGGDLFFDCTGFSRVLIEGALNEPWVGFNNKTYTDSAWAAQRPYKDKEKELKLYTNSVAMSSGRYLIGIVWVLVTIILKNILVSMKH